MTGPKPTVAIFGASGNLGIHITRAFLQDDVRRDFQEIILFTRSLTKLSAELQQWQSVGVVIIQEIGRDQSALKGQLANVDIVVNIIGSAGDKLRTEIVQAMEGTTVKLYIPSEFGVDHYIHDFEHPEWDKKKKHFELAHKLLPNTKICRVFAGLFLEDSIGPWFGFNTKNGQFECYGRSTEKSSYTSLDDVGRSVAALALIPPDQIPPQLHLSGDLISMESIANVMRNKSGVEITTVERPLEVNKHKELANPRPDPSGCLRFLMGEGKIQHIAGRQGCDNELVNRGEHKWKWKTMADLAEETHGQPWADSTWP